MTATATSHRNARYKPALAWFATLGSAWVFVLVMLGAFTTSIGAGMAFPDWPLSNGSLNPEGWLTDVAMFAEHSHRLSGATMGLITIGLAVWLALSETRAWVRRLGWAALAIVILQGIIGGQRVRLDAWHLFGWQMSIGQMLRIPHGILAQIYVIVLFAIAAALSRAWIEAPLSSRAISRRVQRVGIFCTALVLVQLVVAATMRHVHAGLAIPTFPLTPQGELIPSVWNFHIGIHFTHRALALILSVALVWYALAVWREPTATPLFRRIAFLMVTALAIQVALGVAVIWSTRNPYYTTAHVIVGACTLALTFLLTWFAHRNWLESALSFSPLYPTPSVQPRPAKVSLPGSDSSPARS